MKKLFILFLFTMIPYQLIAKNIIDERIADIYYGNGILTTKAEARSALNKLLLYSGDIIPISNNSATIPPWHA
ncbi:MAG: hypothetical protein B5M52_05605 [Helicobacteraceae bacterium 4484_230]|nr:MAG: hypothetical protein B5M52_05605 [Helicobacteraceae bacterium 4484_230]